MAKVRKLGCVEQQQIFDVAVLVFGEKDLVQESADELVHAGVDKIVFARLLLVVDVGLVVFLDLAYLYLL